MDKEALSPLKIAVFSVLTLVVLGFIVMMHRNLAQEMMPEAQADWNTYVADTFSFTYPSDYQVLSDPPVNTVLSLLPPNEASSSASRININGTQFATYEEALSYVNGQVSNPVAEDTTYGTLISGQSKEYFDAPFTVTTALIKNHDGVIMAQTTETDPEKLQVFKEIAASFSGSE